jgi:hypothetical protein
MWDAFQRDVLGAMGHTLLVPAAGAPPLAPPVLLPPGATGAEIASRPALLQALALAAGLDAQADLAGLAALPPLHELRTPAAKRLLWPRLRRLRSGRHP